MSPAACSSSLGIVVSRSAGDLPIGTLSMPGAGMLPKIVCVLIILFGADTVLARQRKRAVRRGRLGRLPATPRMVIGVTASAIALYTHARFHHHHAAAAVRAASSSSAAISLRRRGLQRRRRRRRPMSVRLRAQDAASEHGPVQLLGTSVESTLDLCCSASPSPCGRTSVVCVPRLPRRHAGRRAARHRAACPASPSCCR